MSTRRRELIGRGVRRYREVIPTPWLDKVPPVAGYTEWFDGDDRGSLTLSHGGALVDQWNSKGSGAHHGTPPSETRAPCFARHPTLFRGRTALRWQGLSNSLGTVLSSGATANSRTQTSFVVAVVECDLGSITPTLIGSNVDGGNRFKVSVNSALATDRSDVAGVGEQGNAFVTAGVPFLGVQVLTATDVTHILYDASNNGVQETDANSNSFSASTLQIGAATSVGSGNAQMTGWIAEVLIYDSTLGSSDIASVAAWLRSKWDV